ncbi:PREDICTED: solute carrier family 41 member 1-like [Dufourea novaeangliae]|uniref:Solute carrier family 41 member 1 n=1 Tax=Dufourea novaeangliae TaxID=178035 RepID=A0A154PMJ4_DUFNO|nr:PREDICTED: solute carrier family 41 member 1-like [Dufourea novaeangliae]KZC12518.1 Solute carrier family 41 member 1 [Dufourea novaeangliae]
MSHANTVRRCTNNLSKIRHRKTEHIFYGSKMVELGSDESLGTAITDVTMETEMESDEDGESDEEHVRRLIPSPVGHQCVGKEDRQKSATRNSEMKQVEDENVWSISIQMFIPFLLAGFGMVAASLLLDVVQHWPVYSVVSEVYILVPALLGLKGNLEMTLASRLSTHANLGHMDTRKQQWTLIMGNLALIQCQAIVVGMLASLAAAVLGWIPDARFDVHHVFLLCASALATASIASFLLGIVMVTVILLSKRMKINPDNVATPIAASLGDLTTLALLSGIASLLYEAIDYAPWIAPTCIAFHIVATPFWGYIAARNPFTKEILDYGWAPVICAMLISSAGGLILDYTISNYKGIAVFQLIINGVGGNLVAVQASRMSTSLHRERRSSAQEKTVVRFNPFYAYFAKGGHARTARVLLGMVIPGHLIFGYAISYLQAGHTSFTPIFIIVYLTAALLQVILLLYIAQLMVVWMWTRGIDPDSSAIPYLTAVGDLIGTALLGIAFHILYAIGDGDSDVGD